MATYADYQVTTRSTPFLASQVRNWFRAHGITKDYYFQQVHLGVKLRFPDYASADALSAIGDERLIDRTLDTTTGVSETDAQFAAYLKTAWDRWYWGGTAFGLLTALARQGYSTANSSGPSIIIKNGRHYTLDGSGNLVITVAPTWTFPPPNLWNTFLVMFGSPPVGWSSIAFPPTPSSAPSSQEIAKLIRIINLWRPGHAICAGIQVVQSGKVWGFPLTHTWGDGSTWGATTTKFAVPPTPPF